MQIPAAPTPSIIRKRQARCCSLTSKPQHVPPFFHLQHDKLHRWPAAPRQPGQTNRQTDSPPHHSKFSQQGGVCIQVARHLDVISNSAFKGFVAEAHCLLSRSSKIIVELNSQEQLERKREKNPNPKCKRTSQRQQISGLFEASESICPSLWLHCVSFHRAHTMQDTELTRVFV